ncbi:Tn3 family transposase [Streptomyces exfoliatus]|uniref:Tn3 family transposase n=1 Tax=Streptomyces exfoliatus TaxID=1905 RepID=UPI003C2B19FB
MSRGVPVKRQPAPPRSTRPRASSGPPARPSPATSDLPRSGPLQSALVHVNTLMPQQVLAEPSWAKKLSDEDQRGLTALFWSNINPYGTLRLEMDRRLDLAPLLPVPRPRTPADASGQALAEPR